MLRRGLAVAGLLLVSLCVNAQGVYYPDALWQRKTSAEAGINAALLKGAIDFAVASESRNPRDLTLNHYQTFGREPFGQAIGPIKDRGDQTGVVVYKGYLVAEWGEPSRVDMTHRSEEHTSELQSRPHLVCRLLLEKKKQTITTRL